MEEVFKALGCTNTEGLFDCNLSIEAQSDYSFDQEKNKQSINTEGFFSDVHKLQSPLITEEKCVVEDVTERECRIDNVFVNDQQQEPNIRTDLIADEETFQSAIVIANKLTQENKFGNQSTDEDSVLQESHKLPSSFNKSMLRGTPMIEKILLSSEIESIPNIQSFLQDNADNLYTSCIENGQGLKTKGLYFTPIPVSEPEVSQLQVSIDYQHSIEAFKNNQEHYISTQNKSKDNQVISRPSLLQSKHSSDIEDSSESNPLRMLRKGRLVQPKVRGNKHSIPLSIKGTVVCPSTVKPIGNGQNDKKYIPSESPPLPSSENSLSSLSSHMSVTLENDIRQEPIPIKETSAKTQDFWFGDCDENFLSNAELTFNSLDDHLLSFPRSQIDSSHFSRQQQQRYPSTLTSEDYEKIKSTILSKQSHPSSLNVSNSGSFSNWKAISEGKINSVTSYEGKVSSKDELTVARSDPLRISRMQEGLIKETDSDEVRIIQKVLAENNVTPEECVIALKETDWDVHKAVKVLQLQCTVNIHNLEVEDFKQTLIHCNWNVQHAADFLLARYIAGEDTTEL
ncbi:uncharacterized protein LOC106466063 isoform X1 [Limulus polyphemus]|uniref:Uncharacterized protein LOC106466063 isoform X1 n=1 Tax=Limulus polyphemus TaxID=6850 RepID=A0ABM1T1G5_LIMPO|nr:uncharacterized protein LOC106466063 isoform X1 [Limulus polyphemus]